MPVFIEWGKEGMIMKPLIPFIMLLFAVSSYAFLPISIDSSDYNFAANLSFNASASDYLGAETASGWCLRPSGSNHTLSLINMSGMWSGMVTLNESGSWGCYGQILNDTGVELNSTNFTVSCPVTAPITYLYSCYRVIPISLGTNQTYFEVGDDVILWAGLTNTTSTSSIYIYSADNTTTSCSYSLIKNDWYCYYHVRQAQEVLTIQSFNSTGGVTGLGEYVLTSNPLTVTASSWESLWKDAINYIILGIIIIVGVLILVTLGPTIVYMIFEGTRKR
jgi:hypothetical protein